MPYLLAGKNIVDQRGEFHDQYATAGVDVRYEPSQNLTGVLSLNPDFTQLESQVTDINFSDNEKLIDENRPFFQEGAAYFGTAEEDLLYFYSNRVPDFYWGTKYFAQWGKYQSGAFVTQAPDNRWDAAARLNYELWDTHNVTGMVVASEQEELSNQLVMARLSGRQSYGLSYGQNICMVWVR